MEIPTQAVTVAGVSNLGLEVYTSSQPLTINSLSNYSVTFSCSGQTVSASPATLTYQSSIGYQIPITVTYSETGNLNVPVSIITSGLPSAFTNEPTNMILDSVNSSSPMTIFRNGCYIDNTSLQFNAYDFADTDQGRTGQLQLVRGYSIPVSLYCTDDQTIVSGGEDTYSLTFSVVDSSLSCSPYAFSWYVAAPCPSCGGATPGYYTSHTYNLSITSSVSLPTTDTLPDESEAGAGVTGPATIYCTLTTGDGVNHSFGFESSLFSNQVVYTTSY